MCKRICFRIQIQMQLDSKNQARSEQLSDSLTWHIRMSKMSHKNQSSSSDLGPLGVQKGGSDVPGTQLGPRKKRKKKIKEWRKKIRNETQRQTQAETPTDPATEKQISNSDATIYIVHSHCCFDDQTIAFLFLFHFLFAPPAGLPAFPPARLCVSV